MTQVSELAGNHVFRVSFPVAMASAATDDEYVGFTCPFNGTVTAVKWTPGAAVTANGTNYTTVSVRNRGAAAAGTALPASRSYAATNSVALTPESLTLSATAADLSVTAGDVITAQRLHTASGVSVPAGLLEVSIKVR